MTTSTVSVHPHRAVDAQDIAVVGGGMAGMLSALVLARDGHRVTVYERDDTDLPACADQRAARTVFQSGGATAGVSRRSSRAARRGSRESNSVMTRF